MILKKYTVLLILIMVLSFSGCTVNTGDGKVQNETTTVELQGAKSADVEVRMGAGELRVDGGADKLMKADFTYSIPSWKPEVNYKVSSGEGDLEVTHPSTLKNINLGSGNQYKWNLAFNDSAPMDMKIELGAGQSKLNLSTLNLRDLEVKLGAGEVTLDLSGKYSESFNADISGGVGKSTIYLPKDLGVKVTLRKGIGKLNADDFIIKGDSYVNEAYGKSKITLDIEMQAGIGEVNLILK